MKILLVSPQSMKILIAQMGTECGLSALQHSLWPDICSNRLAIWTKALWVCVSPWIFIQINNFFKLPAPGIEPLTLGLQGQCSTPTPRGLTNFILNHNQLWNYSSGPDSTVNAERAKLIYIEQAAYYYIHYTTLRTMYNKVNFIMIMLYGA